MDDIQRKLAVIEEQLGGSNLHNRLIGTAPLVFVTVGLIAGILIQHFLSLPILLWFVVLTFCAVGGFFFSVLAKQQSRPTVAAYIALTGFLCLGAIRLTSHYRPGPNDISNITAEEPKLATIRGLIVTEPYINRHTNWKFARFQFTDPTSSFYLRLTELKAVDGWAEVAGTVRVQVSEPVLDLKTGDCIQAYCWLERFTPAANPGQFDMAGYLARKRVFVGASVKSRDGIEILQSGQTGPFLKVRRAIRNKAAQALLADPEPDEDSRALLQALLLGYRGDIPNDTYQAFRRTGLLHFVSLSGLHLGILAGIVWWICKTAGLLKRARAVVCIVVIGVFLLIVPARPPTVRAAIITWVFCISFFFRRTPNSLNTLSLAAIILLLIRPTYLFEPGWQLSFATVLGIILFTERIYFLIYDKIAENRRLKEAARSSRFLRMAARPGLYILQLLSVGLAAWIGGAGILLYHFHTITPLACIWTVLVFPIVAAILTLGFLKMVLFFLLPTVGAILGVITAGFSDVLIWLVKLIARVDISDVLLGYVSPVLIVLYYSFVVLIGLIHLKRHRIKKAISILLVVVLIIWLGALKYQRAGHNDLVMTCLDVGHGQAILTQLPGGENVLFDAGSLYKSDIGRRTVTPFLDYAGVNKINAIIISHNDIDHINGIPEIVEHCRVEGIYASSAFVGKTNQWGTAGYLKESLNESSLKIQPLREQLHLSSEAVVKILWPNEDVCRNETVGDNDKSVVSLIEFAGRKILLCSDIEEFSQAQLLRLYPGLKADVIIVPHHGSAGTLRAGFLDQIGAEVLICSCGRSRYEKTTLLNSGPGRWFRTSDSGAVSVYISKSGTVKARSFIESKRKYTDLD